MAEIAIDGNFTKVKLPPLDIVETERLAREFLGSELISLSLTNEQRVTPDTQIDSYFADFARSRTDKGPQIQILGIRKGPGLFSSEEIHDCCKLHQLDHDLTADQFAVSYLQLESLRPESSPLFIPHSKVIQFTESGLVDVTAKRHSSIRS